MGFVHECKTHYWPGCLLKRQTLFFSATMPIEIKRLAAILLTDPVKVEVTPESPTVEIIQQSVYFVEKQNKQSLLIQLLKDKTIETVLVFTQMKYAADKLARSLNNAGIRTEAIHGNKSQNARQDALQNFKNRKTRVLVATDIAARGIDIDELTHVLNYELPNIPETYVHRIGRTGRAGAGGVAISFCDWSEKTFLTDIQKLIKKMIPVVKGHSFDNSSMHSIPIPANQTSSNNSARNAGRGKRYGRTFSQRA
jgi:ATP-dependent RNA helicase RhlE